MGDSFKLDVSSDIEEKVNALAWGYRDQVPFALALGITRTAQDVRDGERAEMGSVFDKPTPYTMNSLYLKKATKSQLEAIVWLKDAYDKGTPAAKYLEPEISGGARSMKRIELWLQRKGFMGSGEYLVPGPAAPLDSYGNVSRGYIVKVLSALQAFPEAGYSMNRNKGPAAAAKAKASRMAQFFVARDGHLARGIWQRFGFAFGSAVKPAFFFVPSVKYSKRFDFVRVAEAIVGARLGENVEAAIRQAIATAR